MVELIDVLGIQGNADADGQPLSERTGGHIDKGQTGSRMAFEIGSQGPQLQ